MFELWSLVSTAHFLIAALVIVSILRHRKEPLAMLAWIFAVLLVPLVGSGLYILMGADRIRRSARRRRRRLAHLIARVNRQAERRARRLERVAESSLPADQAAIEQIGRRLSHMPATNGNEVRVFQEANETYTALEEAMRSARDHIHAVYYIWKADETGRHFRDLLIEKARTGVECRLLLDAVGCWTLSRRFLRPLTEAGAQVAFFLPLRPLRKRWSPHLRNHRKIVVCDGHTAFVGSQNIGDEYRGRLQRLSPWYDSHMRVRGAAALFLQQTFAEDWLFATRQDLADERYFPDAPRAGRSIVQVLPTGPDQDVSALTQLLFAAVSEARSSIRIATSYFVPYAGLLMALIHAGCRGVQVELVLPTRSDNPLVLWAGRSFYAELLEAGVHIYEFDAGMLHSKIVTVDDRWCMLGSANMDVRSFRLNFEITALVYDPAVAAEQSRQIAEYCRRSRRISLRDAQHRPLRRQLVEGAARLFAPLL